MLEHPDHAPTHERGEHWTIRALARHWGVSKATVWKLITCGQLNAHRVGRVWRISPEEVSRYESSGVRSSAS